MKCRFSIALLILLTIAISGYAADKKNAKIFLNPADGGADYADQGEYANDWGGAHVIALGDDRFRLVIYPGGLPGDGWNQTDRTQMESKRDGDVVRFQSSRDGWSYSLAKNVLTTTSEQGDVYTMRKTQRTSPTIGAKPPPGALVLFDGTNADAWRNGHMDDRMLLAAGTKTKRLFRDFTLHVEFMTPFKPNGRGQDRGNSGLYLQDRYEVQVLDSFGLTGEFNECGALYRQAQPSINMAYPPLTWQTYDIDFRSARFDDAGKKTENATIDVIHNGVLIHDRREIIGKTGAGKSEGPAGGPIQLQGHGNPVFYRNIWVLEK